MSEVSTRPYCEIRHQVQESPNLPPEAALMGSDRHLRHRMTACWVVHFYLTVCVVYLVDRVRPADDFLHLERSYRCL